MLTNVWPSGPGATRNTKLPPQPAHPTWKFFPSFTQARPARARVCRLVLSPGGLIVVKHKYELLDARDSIERIRFWLKVVGSMIGFGFLFALVWGLTSLASYAMHVNGFAQ